MKRFFCRVCKKVKRVRIMPVIISTPKAEKVVDRVGDCNRHHG